MLNMALYILSVMWKTNYKKGVIYQFWFTFLDHVLETVAKLQYSGCGRQSNKPNPLQLQLSSEHIL